jgi:hypothetical protein
MLCGFRARRRADRGSRRFHISTRHPDAIYTIRPRCAHAWEVT